VLLVITVAGGLVAVAAVVASAMATVFARELVRPRRDQRDDVELLGIGDDLVTLRADDMTLAPGYFGVWLESGAGHLRLGPVLDHDAHAGTVTRPLLGVDSGHARAGPGRWNQYFYTGTPHSALGLPFVEVPVTTPLGAMPAWEVPADSGVPTRTTWAVLVHGRGATREECLRALPMLHGLGVPALVVSYRNDIDALSSPGGRYQLGDVEWRDVEAAVEYALGNGAEDVVLFGWSMGGAIALQLASRSPVADRISGLVLDAPVLDWRDVMRFHARANRVPSRIGRMSEGVLESPRRRRLAGIDEPVSLDRLDWVSRAAELSLPVLIVHSEDDEFVPNGPSRRLAAERPDLVTYLPVAGARHTQEWNLDPRVWDSAVATFLLGL
jgi:alpha-beta hydrolase superfamily lysophospholipase